MFLLVVAGGIASGKSTVAKRFEQLGAARIDLDALSREALLPGSPVLPAIAREFGSDLLDADGVLNRTRLAELVFSDDAALARLEAIEHPAIRALLAEKVARLEAYAYPPAVCVVEIPLLDSALDIAEEADEVLCVICPMDIRRERAILRGMTAEDFEARVAKQPTDAFLMEHSHRVFDNSGTREELIGKADWWWDRFMRGKLMVFDPDEEIPTGEEALGN